MTECAHCGEPFEAKRSDALYCSGACRIAAHRGVTTSEEEAVTDSDVTASPPPDVTDSNYVSEEEIAAVMAEPYVTPKGEHVWKGGGNTRTYGPASARLLILQRRELARKRVRA